MDVLKIVLKIPEAFMCALPPACIVPLFLNSLYKLVTVYLSFVSQQEHHFFRKAFFNLSNSLVPLLNIGLCTLFSWAYHKIC